MWSVSSLAIGRKDMASFHKKKRHEKRKSIVYYNFYNLRKAEQALNTILFHFIFIPKPTVQRGRQKASCVRYVLSLQSRDSFNTELNFKWFLRRIWWPEKGGHPFYSAVTHSCRLNSLQHSGMVPCPWQHRLGCPWTQRETERGI